MAKKQPVEDTILAQEPETLPDPLAEHCKKIIDKCEEVIEKIKTRKIKRVKQ